MREGLFLSTSMRHSIETHLTNQNVNPRFIDYLQGHSSKDTGGNIYMKGIKPEVLKNECVEKIDYGIDWENLKVDWKNFILLEGKEVITKH